MIQLSPAATQELQRLLKRHTPRNNTVRLSLEPGACEKWAYVLHPVTDLEAEDVLVNSAGLNIVSPKATLSYLNGLTVDYSEDLMGGGFRFTNPNADRICGCGNSFSTVADPSPSSVTNM